MRRILGCLLVLGILLAFGGAAYALINPKFTPVHLIDKADLIVLLKINPADAKGQCRAEVRRVLKGKLAAKTLTLDTSKSANPEQGKEVRKWVSVLGDDPALLFIGRGEKEESLGRLHLGGLWAALEKGAEENAWNVETVESHMQATWAGGTDMLLSLTDLILKHPDTNVPCGVGESWEKPDRIGTVPGKVSEALAVDLAGDGELCLYVASEDRDKVFKFDRKAQKFEELTARRKLGAKSRAAAWADYNGDGRLDLASSNGTGLTLWLQMTDGTFVPSTVAAVPAPECLGLTAMDAGAKNRAGLLWSSAAAPVLLVPDRDKSAVFTQKPLAAGGALKDPGLPGKCLVADFDGDGIADIIQPFGHGSLFFKGKGGGELAEAVSCPVVWGEGRSSAFLGDFAAEGRIGIFALAEDRCRLWQNVGGGKFVEALRLSGEVDYISKPDGICGNTCDVNNDGLQDLFVCYANMSPQIFFNRGFRSFGHAHAPVDLAENGMLPEAAAGQQAGIVADFSGNGAQDMVLVLLDGSVCFLQHAMTGDAALSVRVALAPGGNYAGPVTVMAANDCRPLGAWVVTPGVSEAFLGRVDSGEVTFTWQLPGGAKQTKTLTLDDRPLRFVIADARQQ